MPVERDFFWLHLAIRLRLLQQHGKDATHNGAQYAGEGGNGLVLMGIDGVDKGLPDFLKRGRDCPGPTV